MFIRYTMIAGPLPASLELTNHACRSSRNFYAAILTYYDHVPDVTLT